MRSHRVPQPGNSHIYLIYNMQKSKFEIEFLISNIRAAYYQAAQHPSILDAGMAWYENAYLACDVISVRHRVSIEAVAGIVAALSPRNSWERSLVDCETILRAAGNNKTGADIKVCTFPRNKAKALNIAYGASPDAVLSGNKIRDFWFNILHPADESVVVVDGHAYHIALGRLAPLDKVPSLTDGQYQLLGDAYRAAAAQINQDSLEGDVLPCQVQAVTWTYYRVVRGVDRQLTLPASAE